MPEVVQGLLMGLWVGASCTWIYFRVFKSDDERETDREPSPSELESLRRMHQ